MLLLLLTTIWELIKNEIELQFVRNGVILEINWDNFDVLTSPHLY